MTSDRDLHDWIENSRKNRGYLKTGLRIFAVIALLVLIVNHRAGLLMLFFGAVVAVSGFWVLAGHIADWEGQLARRRVRAQMVNPRG